jgi:hypothetical protein
MQDVTKEAPVKRKLPTAGSHHRAATELVANLTEACYRFMTTLKELHSKNTLA